MRSRFTRAALMAALLAPLLAFAGGSYDHKPKAPHGDVLQPPPSMTQNTSQSQAQGQHQGQSDVSHSQSASDSHSDSTGGSNSLGAISSDSHASTTSQGGSSDSGGNSYSSYESIPRQTPPAMAGFVQPTSSCKNARNGGASAPVAGLSFGWSTSDNECDLRETAREFWEMGQPQTAVTLLCQSNAAKRIPSCAYVAPVAVVPVAAVAPDAVTHAELLEVERRIIQRSTAK